MPQQYQSIQIFVPCFIDQMYPDTAVNMVKLLRQAGCEVDYNPKQTCCGQPAFNAGFWAEAQKVGEKWIEDMAKLQRPIVCPSSSCVGYVRNFMSDFKIENPELKAAYEAIEIYEFSDFMVNKLNYLDFGAKFPHKVTYHDACAALRECKIKEEPRQLLAKVEGLQLKELEDGQQCCGFGGTFAVKFEPISTAMGEKKVEHAIASGAEYLVSADYSCLMHLEGYIKKHQSPIKTIHLIDLLASK
jgi:L-lactate dehydrogenase complex protein LldE